MPDQNSDLETARQLEIRLLQILADNDFTMFKHPENSRKELLALKDLLSGFYIEGIPRLDAIGIPFQFLNVRITTDGRNYLEQLRQDESEFVSLPQENEILRFQIREMVESKKSLTGYWMSAGWGERFGMFLVFAAVFTVGYLCARNQVISGFIDLFRSAKP